MLFVSFEVLLQQPTFLNPTANHTMIQNMCVEAIMLKCSACAADSPLARIVFEEVTVFASSTGNKRYQVFAARHALLLLADIMQDEHGTGPFRRRCAAGNKLALIGCAQPSIESTRV